MNRSHRHARFAAIVLMSAALGPLAQAISPAAEPPLPADLALVPGNAIGFIRVRVADLYDSPLGKQLRAAIAKEDAEAEAKIAKETGIPIADLASATFIMHPSGLAIVLNTRAPMERAALAKMLGQPVNDSTGPYKLSSSSSDLWLEALDNRTFVLEPHAGRLRGAMPKDDPLRAPLATADRSKIAAGLNSQLALFVLIGGIDDHPRPPRQPAVLDESKPALQKLAQLMSAAKVISATFDLDGAGATLAVRVDGMNDAAAAEKLAKDGLKLLADWLGRGPADVPPRFDEQQVRRLFADLRAALDKAAVTRTESAVTIKLTTPVLSTRAADTAAGVVAAVGSYRAAAERLSSLESIAGRLRISGPARGQLPAYAIYAKDGKTPLLSWRVAILPHLLETELYKQFRLDEPWDSDHNRKLIPRMPKVYRSPNAPAEEPGRTHYQVFVGGGAVFDRGPNGPRLSDIADGEGDTLLVVEAADAVPWTKPDDLAFDPAKPLPKLGGNPRSDSFMAVFCDASVRTIRKGTPEAVLKALVTRAGGELVAPGLSGLGVERKPVVLADKHTAGTRGVELTALTDVHLRQPPNGRTVFPLAVGLTEHVWGVTPRGTTPVELMYDALDLDAKPAPPQPANAAPPAVPRLARVLRRFQDSARGLTLSVEVASDGAWTHRSTSDILVPPAVRPAMRQLNTQVLALVRAMSFPLPGREVEPGTTWDFPAELYVLVGDERLDRAAFPMKLRYVGVRDRGGRPVAVVEITGTLAGTAADSAAGQGPGSREKLTGTAKGSAVIDVTDGFVAAAKIHVDFALRPTGSGDNAPASAVGKMDLNLRRTSPANK